MSSEHGRMGPTRQSALAGLVACLLSLAAWPAGAHDFWIEPSSFHPPPGSVVSVSLRVGENFIGDTVRRQSSLITRFAVLQDGEEQPIAGSDNMDPAGLFEAEGQETSLIVYEGGGSRIDLPAKRFDDYLIQNGLSDIVAERARRGEQDRAGRERFYRNAKTVLAGRYRSDRVTRPVGLRYEIVPLNDPTAEARTLDMQVLLDGEPLAGAQVEAIARDRSHARIVMQSDAGGKVRLHLPQAGVWLIRSVHVRRAGWFSDVDWESDWASLTFEMLEK